VQLRLQRGELVAGRNFRPSGASAEGPDQAHGRYDCTLAGLKRAGALSPALAIAARGYRNHGVP
jgi:hypothetical protein